MRRVFLCAGDESGWAIDEDRRLTALSLEGVARVVERPDEAEVIHACWWEPLMRLPREAVAGKPVVCQMAGDPARVMSEPAFVGAMGRVTQWVAQSRHGWERMRVLSAGAALVPYAVDPMPFQGENGPDDPRVARARAEVSRARRSGPAYVVASFHRDTAGAQVSAAMDVPKLVKGPDVLVEVLSGLRAMGVPVVALLAGPRRQWVRARLASRGVPVIYAGDEHAGDDYPANTLPREQLARLYALADVCVSTSRSEGGPRAILEAAAAGIAQLATRTGLAEEVLHPDAIVDDAAEAIERMRADHAGGVLRRLAPASRALVRSAYTVEANRARWAEVYRGLEARHEGGAGQGATVVRVSRGPAVPPRPSRAGRVGFWNKFTTGPWGGGNQFMTALMTEAARAGVRASANGEGGSEAEEFAGHVVNSVQFDMERFEAMVRPGATRVVHRIDGPISVLRGTPDSMEQDRRCFEFNRTYATATVIQSWHTVRALAELGFAPVRPVLILNAADPAIFHPPATPREPGPPPARLRIVASAWSPSPGKGAAIYEWMDRNLDPARYEFTFVGNTPAALRHARVVPPLPSRELAALLREQDVYVTASRNDPCSNALIEALSCGLPALYYDSGGHPELVGMGGLAFRRPEEIPALLERLREHHGMYRRLIAVPTLADVARRYLDLIFGDSAYRSER